MAWTLRGLYLPAQNPRCCALLFHGYRSRGLREFSLLAPFYHSQGISMLIPDQRACGESDGTYITFGVLERRTRRTGRPIWTGGWAGRRR